MNALVTPAGLSRSSYPPGVDFLCSSLPSRRWARIHQARLHTHAAQLGPGSRAPNTGEIRDTQEFEEVAI